MSDPAFGGPQGPVQQRKAPFVVSVRRLALLLLSVGLLTSPAVGGAQAITVAVAETHPLWAGATPATYFGSPATVVTTGVVRSKGAFWYGSPGAYYRYQKGASVGVSCWEVAFDPWFAYWPACDPVWAYWTPVKRARYGWPGYAPYGPVYHHSWVYVAPPPFAHYVYAPYVYSARVHPIWSFSFGVSFGPSWVAYRAPLRPRAPVRSVYVTSPEPWTVTAPPARPATATRPVRPGGSFGTGGWVMQPAVPNRDPESPRRALPRPGAVAVASQPEAASPSRSGSGRGTGAVMTPASRPTTGAQSVGKSDPATAGAPRPSGSRDTSTMTRAAPALPRDQSIGASERPVASRAAPSPSREQSPPTRVARTSPRERTTVTAERPVAAPPTTVAREREPTGRTAPVASARPAAQPTPRPDRARTVARAAPAQTSSGSRPSGAVMRPR